jgi:repressor LexA
MKGRKKAGTKPNMERYTDKVLRFFKTQHRMPSITEIMELCDLASRSSAFYVANALVKEGVVDKDESGKLVPSRRLYELPLVGHIRAGFAAPAEEELADVISVGDYLIPHPNQSYLLTVVGDSMIDAGIHEGDLVVFERRHNYKPGDIVIALTENGYTLKYLRQKGGTYYLEAANENYPNMYPDEGQIIGVVSSTFRKYGP